MPTALVSDLHLGAVAGADVARRRDAMEHLAEALDPADRIVLLGDLLEMRERPLAELLDVTRPFFERLAETVAGKSVVLMAGRWRRTSATGPPAGSPRSCPGPS
jgi:metallophosphoesterase superfamily enzyme